MGTLRFAHPTQMTRKSAWVRARCVASMANFVSPHGVVSVGIVEQRAGRGIVDDVIVRTVGVGAALRCASEPGRMLRRVAVDEVPFAIRLTRSTGQLARSEPVAIEKNRTTAVESAGKIEGRFSRKHEPGRPVRTASGSCQTRRDPAQVLFAG